MQKDISNAEMGVLGSFRQYSMADGIYIGGIVGLNIPATETIEFGETGITIKSTKQVNVEAPTVNVNATTSAKVVSPSIDLGGDGGLAIARQGDQVVQGTTVVGTIKASSVITRSL